MNNPVPYILNHLRQRNLKISLMKFLYLPFTLDKQYYELSAHNQVLFTEMAKLPARIRIIADNNAIETDENSRNLSAWEDFSGQITIELNNQKDEQGNDILPQINGIEFIQVFLS